MRCDFVVLKVGQSLVRCHAQLHHVQQLVLEETAEHQVVGSLLGRGPEDKQIALVADNQVLNLDVVLEWSHVVAAGQRLGQGFLQVVQVLQCLPDGTRAFAALQEQRILRCLDQFRLPAQQNLFSLAGGWFPGRGTELINE